MRLSTGSSRRIASSGSPRLSINRVEFRMSANSTVRRLRSPPLLLRDRSRRCEGPPPTALCVSAVPHWPQNRLAEPLIWLHASHLIPNGAPQFSQYPLSTLFCLPH